MSASEYGSDDERAAEHLARPAVDRERDDRDHRGEHTDRRELRGLEAAAVLEEEVRDQDDDDRRGDDDLRRDRMEVPTGIHDS